MASETILTHKAYTYAQNVVEGNIISAKYIKKACKKFLDDVHNPNCKYEIDEKQLQLITGLTALINMATGLKVGIPAKEALAGFQWFFLVNALCWVHKDRPEKRRYEKSVLLIARKSGKSFLVGLIFLILMILEPEFSEFYSVAPDRELSSIVKKEIQQMIDASPAIVKYFQPLRSEIRCTLKKSKFVPLATSDNRMDGRLANVFVADEVGALKNRYPISAMESSQMNLINRTGILISTAYESLHNPMTEEVEYAQKVLDGLVQDETLFALLYMPDDPSNWLDDNELLKANPLAYDLPDNLEQLKKQRAKALEIPSEQQNFKTKHMNIFVDGDVTEQYIETDDLRKCKVESYDWYGKDVYIGVDLSQSEDNTAVSMVTFDKEINKYVTKTWAFLPDHGLEVKEKRQKIPYRTFEKNKWCVITRNGTKNVDYSVIEDHVITLQEKYGVRVKGIGYDRFQAIATANKWINEGFEVVMVKQNLTTLYPPTKFLKEKVLTGQFAYEKNDLFEINMSNARQIFNMNMDYMIGKKASHGKIDMTAATINAMYLWYKEVEDGTSIYEDDDLRPEGFIVL